MTQPDADVPAVLLRLTAATLRACATIVQLRGGPNAAALSERLWRAADDADTQQPTDTTTEGR